MNRKGFPESYNMGLLSEFLSNIVSGKNKVLYPIYSQELSDIVPGKFGNILHPDILIIEGINTLQLPPNGNVVTSDFFDFSIYIDADENQIKRWFIERFRYLLKINKIILIIFTIHGLMDHLIKLFRWLIVCGKL